MSDTKNRENICNNIFAVVAFTALMPLHCVFALANLYNNHSILTFKVIYSVPQRKADHIIKTEKK